MQRTLYVTLRLKRRPISGDVKCISLRANTMLPVHKQPDVDDEISEHTHWDDITKMIAQHARRNRCTTWEIDAKRDVLSRIPGSPS